MLKLTQAVIRSMRKQMRPLSSRFQVSRRHTRNLAVQQLEKAVLRDGSGDMTVIIGIASVPPQGATAAAQADRGWHGIYLIARGNVG
jgi:ribosomal protein L10